ncbi:MAG: hypothetical protein HY675_07510 [Chloroflexi bacterium]|nr:hypothetical protein [Chloroflexota bacterium]
MSATWTKGLSHREFLKACGLALAGAGASQMVVPPKAALAADGSFDNLTVTGNTYLCTTSGNVGIGTSNAGARLQLLDTANNNNPLIHVLNENNWKEIYCEAVSNGADDDITMRFRKARGTIAAKTAAPNNDRIGAITWDSYSGLAYYCNAAILAYVDGTASGASTPGRLVFNTTPDGSTAAQTRMVIKNDGKVGIGTTGPVNKLHVNGPADSAVVIGDRGTNGSVGLQFLGTGVKHAGIRFDGSSIIVENASMSYLPSTWYQNSDLNFIVRNGKVGIGTTEPQYLLHLNKPVGGAYGVGSSLMLGRNNDNLYGGAIWDSHDGTIDYMSLGVGWGINPTSNPVLTIRATTYGATGGNVGIGTPEPGAKLQVAGNALIVRDFDGTAPGRPDQIVFQAATTPMLRMYLGLDTTNKYALIQAVEDGVAWRHVVLARDGGNVGIGTTGPGQRLHVAGNTRVDGEVWVNSSLKIKCSGMRARAGERKARRANGV